MFAEWLGAAERLDFAAFQQLRSFQWSYLTVLLAGLSDMADGAKLWIALTILVAVLRPARWPAAVQALLAIGLTVVVVDSVAKPFVDRVRPYDSHSETITLATRPTTASFPSGHAANAVAGAYLLTRLAPEARSIFWLLAVLVAFSRVYLGVHYPADVLGGGVFGWAVSAFVVGGTIWRFQRTATATEPRR